MLSNYRSGSIFLCKFLEYVGKYEDDEFYERFNPNRPVTLKKYYNRFPIYNYPTWKNGNVRKKRDIFFKHVINKGKLPAHLKIMRDQFFETCGLMDSDKDVIERELPNLRYIFIRRSDVLRITISHYFAIKTGRWVLPEKDRNDYFLHKIRFNEKEIVNLYHSVYKYVVENNWDKYLTNSDHLLIDFDILIRNPLATFKQVLAYLGIDVTLMDINDYIDNYPFLQTRRPETDDYVDRLKQLVY